MHRSYEEIVKDINRGLEQGNVYYDDFVSKPGKPLREVNAWTYWQGVGVRHPKVMIVGQDWGAASSGQKFFDAIDEMDLTSDVVEYFKYVPEIERGGGKFATDANLAKCLEQIGYRDVIHIRDKDLFFTNLIPGYRKEKSSTGGFRAKWFTDQAKKDFRDLVSVLKPKVIICLGKDTYKQVCKLYGIKGVAKGEKWNNFLGKQETPIDVTDENGITTHIFASAHPGALGANNRGEDAMFNDWERIKDWMAANHL